MRRHCQTPFRKSFAQEEEHPSFVIANVNFAFHNFFAPM
jgi:hypothetical protein